MRPRSRRAVWPVLTFAVVAAACGSDGADPEPYVEALRAELRTADDGPALSGEAAECVAEGVVDAADADRLHDAGITPAQLADAESFQDLEAFDVDDADLRRRLEGSLDDCPLGQPLADAFARGLPFELPSDGQRCVADALDEGEELATALAATFVADDDSGFEDAFVAALAACPATTSGLIATAIEESSDVEVSRDERRCLADEMTERGEDGVRRLLSGGEAAGDLSVEIGERCLRALGA